MSRIQEQPGKIEATVAFEIPSTVTQLTVATPPGTTVDGATDFRRSGAGQLVWERTTNSPQISLTISVQRNVRGGGRTTADTGNWAIVEAPQLATQWQHRGGAPTVERKIVLKDRGVASNDANLVYLGPHMEFERDVGGHRIRLIEPRAASLQESPREILEALEFAATELPLEGHNDEVLAIAAPTQPVNWGPGGLHAGGNAFWARDSARLDKANSTWVHEYIHTRQEFSVDPQMKWFVEATAVYYATRSIYKEGRISDKVYHAALNPSRCENDMLAAPRRWSTAHVPYQKGSRVAAWLDKQLRSKGFSTLADVFRLMNQVSDGNVTDPSSIHQQFADGNAIGYDQFKQLLKKTTDRGPYSNDFDHLQSTMDSVVTGNEIPDETPPPGLTEIPDGPLPETGMPTDVTEVLEEALGEEFREELLKGDGRIEESVVFGDGADGGLIEDDDMFETDFESEEGDVSVRIVSKRFDGLDPG
jgi:hypothetical protein